MAYMVPGMLAGIVFYGILAAVSARIPRVGAHGRLIIHCLASVAFAVFLVTAGGGGNSATHMQISGFVLAGCALSLVSAKKR